MKFFGSKEGEPLDQCLAKIRECNYYAAIIGHRYGEVERDSGLSYTELEYEEAKHLEIARRIYIASNAVLVQPEQVESDEKRKQLDAFKQKLKRENTVVFFDSPGDLTTKVVSDILLNISEKPAILSFARKKYLPAIRSTCSSISFLGLDIQTMKRHKDVKLENVYVQNKFGKIGSPTENPVAPGTTSAGPLSPTSSAEPSEALSLEQMLSRTNQVVVLGDPGCGKSTLTKYLVTAVVDRAANIATAMRATLPVRIPLRSYGEFRQRSGGIGVTIS
jgi:GTPase SAR1 family protein